MSPTPKNTPAAAERVYDDAVAWVDGPLNTRAEKLLKNRLVLAGLGASMTAWTHGALFWKRLFDRSLSQLGGGR